MADFAGHLCWSPETAAATVNTEAVSPSRAVFLATHAPLRIRRARLDGRAILAEEKTVDERAVVKDFLTRKSDTGALLMPIVGDSGSGKSHLVRWVYEQLPPSDGRKVIYLEKARTSLRAVIDSLLDGAQEGPLAQLKADIHKFSESLDATALSRRLINALIESLAATTASDVPNHARQLAGPRGLMVALQDPHVSAYMLSPGKFIPQLAGLLLHDRSDGASDHPVTFSIDDLPTDILDLKPAARVTQKLLSAVGGSPQLQQAAVDLLNQYLEPAVKRVAGLGAGRLQDAMLEVRREYARQGMEIVLLIEDFALIQGVQRDLLDAVIEAANRNGTTSLAPIRTLMAVTTRYFRDLPETALTRVRATTGYVYDLDVPFSPDDDGAVEIASFVGRYLNAARVGREKLEGSGERSIPNPCEGCDFRPRCHEDFGATKEGYGLYPFNESALVRAIHSTAPRDDPYAFVPRTVLGSVVRPVLVEHASALRDLAFPDERFRTRFPRSGEDLPLSTAVGEVVDAEDHQDPERRKTVLEWWGNAPGRVNDLPPAVFEAFGLEPLTLDEGRGGTVRTATPAPGVGAAPRADIAIPAKSLPRHQPSLPQSLERKLQSLETWATSDKPMLQDVAADLRTVLTGAVVRRYRWMDPLMQVQGQESVKSAWPSSSRVVSIEGAKGENLVRAAEAPIRLKPTNRNSRFLQSMLLLKNGHMEIRAEHVRRLSSLADEHHDSLTRALQQSLQVVDDQLVLGMRASLIGAALAGRAWPGMDDTELLSAVFDDGHSWHRQDRAGSTWAEVMARHLQNRLPLVERLRASLGVSQGLGQVRIIDAARALPLLREAARHWHWDTGGHTLPDWVKPAVGGFANWNSLVDNQNSLLYQQLNDIRSRYPRGSSSVALLSSIRAALDAAREVGLPVPSSTDAEIKKLLDLAQRADWQAVTQLEDDLARATDPERSDGVRQSARITAAARDRGQTPDVVRRLLLTCDAWLDSALEAASLRGNSAGDDAARGVQELLAEWQALGGAEVEVEEP